MDYAKICNRIGKIWLAESASLGNSLNMSFGKASETSASRLATARYDDRESAGGGASEALSRIASALKLARVLRVPVGYEDETGFHCGAPQLGETSPVLGPEKAGPRVRCDF
jgi:hypothetical protein